MDNWKRVVNNCGGTNFLSNHIKLRIFTIRQLNCLLFVLLMFSNILSLQYDPFHCSNVQAHVKGFFKLLTIYQVKIDQFIAKLDQSGGQQMSNYVVMDNH